jgi:hypothetical protein
MNILATEALTEGMIVAKDVYDYKDDRLLLKKGTILSIPLIDKLKNWGVRGIYVIDPESNGDSCEAEIEAQRIIGLIEDLDKKFSNFTNSNIMNNLKNVVKEYLQGKMANKGGNSHG